MKNVATTRLSSKGQVVIPEVIRETLNLHEGAQFVVFGEGDIIIFKSIEKPSFSEFDGLITKARHQAKAAGLTANDGKNAIKTARKVRKK